MGDIFTADAKGAEKILKAKRELATDPHGHTRTGKIKTERKYWPQTHTDPHGQGLNSEFGMGKAERRIWNAKWGRRKVGEAGRLRSEEAGKRMED
jgi:hypothetical protein